MPIPSINTCINPSTKYYRDNRKSKRVIHSCQHCNYATTNAKICLINHINAKHVDEKDRPYQCQNCERGFAQKAHLDKHMSTIHNIDIKPLKVSSISYIIKMANNSPKSTKTKARCEYYENHHIINTNEINHHKHEYLPGVYLKKNDLHYDNKKGFIEIDKCFLYKSEQKLSINLRRRS
jgi:hypothetical protein